LLDRSEDGLASDICYKDQYFWVANSRLSTLIEFALEVGQNLASTPQEAELVARLRRDEDEDLFPGCSFDLGERFPTLPSKMFWARVFREVAHQIFLRQLGNEEIDSWQASTIGDACLIDHMLTHAVRVEESHCLPPGVDAQTAEEDGHGPIKIRL
jgi:hypothetical protein